MSKNRIGEMITDGSEYVQCIGTLVLIVLDVFV